MRCCLVGAWWTTALQQQPAGVPMLRLHPASPVIGNASPPTDTFLTSQAPFLTVILPGDWPEQPIRLS